MLPDHPNFQGFLLFITGTPEKGTDCLYGLFTSKYSLLVSFHQHIIVGHLFTQHVSIQRTNYYT